VKRSEINQLMTAARACFTRHHWVLPPQPRWDVTDFGLGDWRQHGMVLVNLASEPEYCEKLMYAQRGMITPCHCHHRKKEDIICRCGALSVKVWPASPDTRAGRRFTIGINGQPREVIAGDAIAISAGERITIPPRVYHEFCPTSDECIIGEVSSANDDVGDNFFWNPDIGRFPGVVEDEPAQALLVGEGR
jgi:D-lyxose ketol-isomerase